MRSTHLSEGDWAEQEARVARFVAGWQPERIEHTQDYLPPDDPLRQAVLIELVHTDLELRTRAGLPVVVSTYLNRFPQLASVPHFAEELVAAHVELVLMESRSAAPRKLGHYELEHEVGRGGSSVVYRGRDARDGRIVAVKVLRGWVGDEPSLVRRFAREVALAARLNHPGLAAASEFGCEAGICYLVSQFVDGVPLSEWMRERKENRIVADVFARICEAVGHAHSLDVLHRDLSSANVLVLSDGRPVVIDFGLATTPSTGTLRTRTGGWTGTPAYLAPELLLGEDPTPASDVYSLGVMLFEILAGRLPYPNSLPHRLRDRRSRPTLTVKPRGLATICLKALSYDPKDRYPDASGLAADLRRLLANEPIAARAPKRFRRPVATLALLLGTIGVSLAVWPTPSTEAARPDDPILAHWMPLLDHPSVRDERQHALRIDVINRAAESYREWSTREPSNLYPRLQAARLATLRSDALAEAEPTGPAARAALLQARDEWKALSEREPHNLFVHCGSALAKFRLTVRLNEWGTPEPLEPARDECRVVAETWDSAPARMGEAIAQLGRPFAAWWAATPVKFRESLRPELEFARLQLAIAANDPTDVMERTRDCLRYHQGSEASDRLCWQVQVLEAAAPLLPRSEAAALWRSVVSVPEEAVQSWSPFARRKTSAAWFQLSEATDSRDEAAQDLSVAVKWARTADDERWLGVCLHQLGTRLSGPEAREAFTEAVQVRRRLAKPDSPAQFQLDRSASAYSLGRWHEQHGESTVALSLYREAHAAHLLACRALPATHPAHRWLTDRVAALARLGG